MGRYAREDIVRLVQEQEIRFIRMQFTDIFGQLKNVAISASQLPKALDNRIMMDGSSIQGFVRVEESDQYLWPDPDTFAVLPWRPQHGRVARMVCDVHNPDGSPFAGDPRFVLKQALRRAEDLGFTLQVGPELEFFLFQTDEDGRPVTRTSDEAGYFDLGPLDHGESTRREICLALEDLGFEIEASHHECAAGQHEIDFRHDEALRTADRIMTFKLAVKTLARKNGLHATFMPKPVQSVAGNGMHINMSLADRAGRNLFCDPSDPRGLSRLAYRFISGLLAHAQGLCAVTNPLVNSYKRLTLGYEAPCHVSWSAGNRSTMVRIPSPRGEDTRVELRSPDPSCNPYLALAVCLAAGLDGIERDLPLPGEVLGNVYELSEQLPALPDSLSMAIRALQADPVILDALGRHVAEQYILGKRREWEAYRARITPWEVERYLVAY